MLKQFILNLVNFKIVRFLFFLLICIVVNQNAIGQTKSKKEILDSLLTVNQLHPKGDSLKLVILKQIYKQYFKLKDFPNSEKYVSESVSLATRLKQGQYVGSAYYNLGLFYHGFANYLKAEENYLKAVESYGLINNLEMVASTYLNLGALYNGIPDYIKSLDANQKAIPIYIKLNDNPGLASCYTNVAQIYKSLNQQYETITYAEKAEKLFEKFSKSNRGLTSVYWIMGNSYINASDEDLMKLGIPKNQKYIKALEVLNKGLKIAIEINDPSTMGPIYQNLATIYQFNGDKDLALKSYQNAIKFTNLEDNKSSYAFSLIALGRFYTDDKQYNKANDLLLEALNIGKKDKSLEIQRNSYLSLSENEEKSGNYTKSLNYFKLYISVKEIIFNEDKEREITRRQLALDFTLKENDYQVKQQITSGELERQLLLAKQQQQQLILNEQKLQLSDKERLLQRLTFLKIEAELENKQDNQINQLNEQRLKSALNQQIKDKQINLQETELTFNRNINIFLGLLAALLFGTAVFIFYALSKTSRLNKIVSEQKQELEKISKVKDRIFSVVSHDMRSPVNSLISFTQLLESGNIDQVNLKRYASQLNNTLGYTSAMMENLLNWASSQMQGFKPLIEKFKLRDSVQDVIDSMQLRALQKEISIHNKIGSELACVADLNMTSLIIRNLISNAIKFTPNTGSITIEADKIGDKLSIAIIDNGVGLTDDQIMDINNLGFLESGNSSFGTNNEKGTGIGLVLCKTFIALMNGNMLVERIPNNGSKFILNLPSA